MLWFDSTQLNRQEVTQMGDMTIHTKGGVVHREDGPAIITSWSKEWAINGVYHSESGPARMFLQHPMPTGAAAIAAAGKHICEWHVNGKYVYQDILDHETFMKHWER